MMRLRVLVSLFALLAASASSANPSSTLPTYLAKTFGITQYKLAQSDLNGDGQPEALVYLTDRTHCGSAGCNLIILSPKQDTYEAVSQSTIVQLPINVLSTSTEGWRDLGVTVFGGGSTRPYMARLRFNGRGYPGNPTVPPAIRLSRASGSVLISK